MTAVPVHVGRLLASLLEAAELERKHRSVRPLERRLERALRAMWRRQQAVVLRALAARRALTEAAWLAEAVTPDDFDPVGDSVPADATFAAALEAILETALGRGAGDVIAEIGIRTVVTFDVGDPAVAAWLTEHAAERIAGIDDVTRAAVRRILVDAADNGWSYARTAKALKERFAGFAARSPLAHLRSRAELIAVTEIGDAYEHAGRVVADLARAQGLHLEKLWVVAGDDRVCVICAPAGAEGWIPDDGTTSFANGFDGPLGHPGCRCALARRTAPTAKVA